MNQSKRPPAWLGWVCAEAGEPHFWRTTPGWVLVAQGDYLPDVMDATAAACPPRHWSQVLASGASPGPVAPPGTRLRPRPRVCRSPWLKAKGAVLAALALPRGKWVTAREVWSSLAQGERAGRQEGLPQFLAWLETEGLVRSRKPCDRGKHGKEWRAAT